jgi:hypothetical protein
VAVIGVVTEEEPVEVPFDVEISLERWSDRAPG